MNRWRRRLEREPDGSPPLPLVPGPLSNGEFVPNRPSARDEQLRRATLDRAELGARRIGLGRRRFLQSSAGVAATLGVYNLAACASGSDGSTPSTTSSSVAIWKARKAMICGCGEPWVP